jgi:putative peptidoglycan lipid II flippase
MTAIVPPDEAPVNPRSAAARQAEARRETAQAVLARATERRSDARRARLAGVGPSLAKATGSMAIATLVSRVTGFLKLVMLSALLGISVHGLNDSYTLANTLPNKIHEFLIGGVLTSVAVPVLVRAQREDSDGGHAYSQRLVTMTLVWMGAGTVLAVAAAPLLTAIYVNSANGTADPALVTVFGYLLLPQIFFYAATALLQAILQAKHVFAVTTWAPVINNVIVLATGGVYFLMPGEITLNPVLLSEPKLLVLGVGTTLGVVAQVVVMLPALHRTGFRWRWAWGLDERLKSFGGLALWVLGYVAIAQLGVLVVDRVSTGAAHGSVTIYNYTWLLVVMPYGVLGFALLTAILPRMSASAADGDYTAVVRDLSLANRYSTVMLGPISALMIVLGPEIGLALFSYGAATPSEATRLGLTLTISAFGLLPYTITLLQSRVFYAMQDARTPTLVMGVMVAVKIPLSYLCPVVLNPEQVVFGLAFVNALSFVLGALAGQLWLRARIGALGTPRVLLTMGKTALASVWGAAATLAVVKLAHSLAPASRQGLAWPLLVAGAVVGGVVTFGIMTLLRVDELRPVLSRFGRRLRAR